MVRKNEYLRKNNISKDATQVVEPVHANFPQKAPQKDGDFYHKENNTRNIRPPRENQQRDDNRQKEYQQRDNQKKENTPRDNQLRENVQRDNIQRENQNKDNRQRNFHRDNVVQNKEGFRDNREPYRQHTQRPAIKPHTDETVEDINTDIVRIEKEIELELKEIQSMRLGI